MLKRNYMKKLFFFSTLCLILTLPGKSQSSSTGSSLFGGKWYLRKIHLLYGHDLPAFKTDTVTGKTAFISFNDKMQSAGGNGGCNTFGARLDAKGHTLHITQVISTQVYCEGVQPTESDFFSALRKINRYVIKHSTLLLYQDKLLLLELER
jgi:META domain